MEVFDKEHVYDSQISPLMTQIIEICKEHSIPMIASFTYAVCQERGPGRCTTLLNSFEGRQDQANQKAASILHNGGHETFAIAIGKSG